MCLLDIFTTSIVLDLGHGLIDGSILDKLWAFDFLLAVAQLSNLLIGFANCFLTWNRCILLYWVAQIWLLAPEFLDTHNCLPAEDLGLPLDSWVLRPDCVPGFRLLPPSIALAPGSLLPWALWPVPCFIFSLYFSIFYLTTLTDHGPCRVEIYL